MEGWEVSRGLAGKGAGLDGGQARKVESRVRRGGWGGRQREEAGREGGEKKDRLTEGLKKIEQADSQTRGERVSSGLLQSEKNS